MVSHGFPCGNGNHKLYPGTFLVSRGQTGRGLKWLQGLEMSSGRSYSHYLLQGIDLWIMQEATVLNSL
jgi:hypothetical protein